MGIEFNPYVDHWGHSSPHLYQSSRLDLYRTQVGVLLDKGLAYKCYCPKTPISDGHMLSTPYDGKCRSLSAIEKTSCSGEPFAIRLKVSLPNHISIRWMHPCMWTLKIDSKVSHLRIWFMAVAFLAILSTFLQIPFWSSQMVRRQEDDDGHLFPGWPTYHLASVVDDHHMNISHVLRGSVGSCADV